MDAEKSKVRCGVSALAGAFDSYPGPVLRLEDDASLSVLNEAGTAIVDCLNGELGAQVMPTLVQLAVKTRSEGRAKSKTFTLPDSGRQIEFMLVPQGDGTQLTIGRDATLEVNIRSALAESRTRFKDLVDVAADFAWETDRERLFCYISPRGALGYAPEELLGERPESLPLAPESAPTPLPFAAESTVRNVELWLRSRSGEPACILVSAMPILGPEGRTAGARGIAIDVTEERQRQSELARLKIRERLVGYIVDALRNEVAPQEMLHGAATALGRASSVVSCVVQVRGAEGGPLALAGFGGAPEPGIVDEILRKMADKEGMVDGEEGPYRYLGVTTAYGGASNGAIVLLCDSGAPDWDEDERALLKAVEPQFGIVFRQIVD